MNKYQSNKYSMYRAVNEVLKNNESLFSGIKRFKESEKEFEKCFDNIEKISAVNKTVSKGLVINKENAGYELADSLLKVGGVLYIAAIDMKKENLKSIAKVNGSELKRMRINDFILKSKDILNYSKSNIDSLKKIHEGIESEINELEIKLNIYESILKTKEHKTVERISSKIILKEEFKKTDYILKNELDKLIELVKTSSIDFYQQYKAARVIKDLGVRRKKTNND
jgi:hypothetical protein